MKWPTNQITLPVKLVENPNVPGVFYVHDNDDDEICVLYGQTEETGRLVVSALNSQHAVTPIAAE